MPEPHLDGGQTQLAMLRLMGKSVPNPVASGGTVTLGIPGHPWAPLGIPEHP